MTAHLCGLPTKHLLRLGGAAEGPGVGGASAALPKKGRSSTSMPSMQHCWYAASSLSATDAVTAGSDMKPG